MSASSASPIVVNGGDHPARCVGLWAALREIFPNTHDQHNMFAALAKSAHRGALAALKEICDAENIGMAQVAVRLPS